ncbi:MAG: UDP-3-O-acylglucosamine N-acyltransferase [Myxococcota bacterium]|nr:UDP-3-O-acylglucosamine N-acyltransferase [Myxococcota bacterium]
MAVTALRSFTAGELASICNGRLAGDASLSINAVAAIGEEDSGAVAFYSDHRYRERLLRSKAALLIVTPRDREEIDDILPNAALIEHARPDIAFLKIVAVMFPPPEVEPWIAPSAYIHRLAEVDPRARVENNAVIGPRVRIGGGTRIGAGGVIENDITIGEGCDIGPRVTIHGYCTIGARVRIGSGCVIGAEGFGFVKSSEGMLRGAQLGVVVIEDDVDLGANCCIDRGAIGETRIGAGSKFDNLVQIGHNVHVGKGCLIAAQVGVAGSTRIEDGAVLGGQVGVTGHVTVGENAVIAGKSGVINDVGPHCTVAGYPAVEHFRWLRGQAIVQRLPELEKRLKELENQFVAARRR